MGTGRSTVALSIAGSDSSAGAGIQADLKTFSALGIYGLTAMTCIVAEIPGKVSRIEHVSARIVREQIEVLVKNFPIGAIKTGLLCSAEIISAVAKAIRSMHRNSASPVPVVIDPVIVATSGDLLLELAAIETYEKELFPLASLITPNLNEAERLLGTEIKDRRSMHRAGKSWRENMELQSFSKVAIWQATRLPIFFSSMEKLSSSRRHSSAASQRTVPAAPIQQRFRLALHPAWRWRWRSGEPRSLWLKQSRNIFDGRRLPEKSSTRLGICCDADNPVCAQNFAGKIGTVGVAVSFGVPRFTRSSAVAA